VGGRFGLPSALDKPFTFDTGRRALSFLAEFRRFFSEPLFKRFCLFETTPLLHGAAPFFE
jgi:hypothetical protein